VTSPSQFAAGDNPFSARNIRPGAIPYHFPPGESVDGLVERLRRHAWWGQIVGPHGSGKSTLLATLLPVIERAGKPTLLVTIHHNRRRLPGELHHASALPPGTLVVVDGYEQLSRFSRFQLKRFCRRRKLGLFATSHHSVGLPEVFRTTTDPQLAQFLVAQLLGAEDGLIAHHEVADRFEAHHGDLRELLFEFYDLYSHRRRAGR